MKALLARIGAELAAIRSYWGARLNALQALIVAAIVTNAGKLEPAIASIVPEQYRPFAGLIAGVVSFVIVNLASSSDAKKVVSNGAR